MNLLPKISPRNDDQRHAERQRNLIRQEAVIGGQLFGPVPAGGRREFFCLDASTWVWYEERLVNGQRHTVTTYYDVRPSGIIKSQNGQNYRQLSNEEAQNLRSAAHLYLQRITAHYRQPQTA